MPDPRAVVLTRIAGDIRNLGRAFPDDPLTPEVVALIAPIKAVVEKIEQQQKERINGETVVDDIAVGLGPNA